jgi:two-component system response regulator PilR (NtrC family)
MQVKLLRAIQERSFRKVGGTDDVKVDVRLIAATNRDLEAAVAAGTFREDLYYRLNVILIRTPSLRERPGDVPILARRFVERSAAKQGKAVRAIDPAAMAALEAYSWPGNIRELENVIERATTLESSPTITLSSLPEKIRAESGSRALAVPASAGVAPVSLPAPDFAAGPLDLEAILSQVERFYITAALSHSRGSKKAAADLLGITFRSIRYRLQKQGIAGADDEDKE